MLLKNKKRIVITIGVCCFALGIYLLSYNYIQSKVLKAYDKMNLEILALNIDLEGGETNSNTQSEFASNIDSEEINDENRNNANNDNENNNENSKVEETSKPKVDKYAKYYIAKLKIPKINLEQGLVSINSKYNTVSKNIQIIKGSSYPNVDSGNLILASHAGTNSVSYFRNLYKLSKGDKCYVTYKNKTYVYKIVDIYTQKKDGTIGIYRDYSKTTLTLVTCTRNSNTKQTIYIAELIQVK